MSLYGDRIFPRLMDWSMSAGRVQEQRASALLLARGDVLEIGFGTGLNLPHYPKAVTSLAAIEPGRFLTKTVEKRIADCRVPVDLMHISAEHLPWEDRRFDCIVSTWTVCTISDPVAALREARRVLKPDGRFIFLEHGRSDDARIAKWQDRLNPIQRIIACGCHFNRRIDRLILDSGFIIERMDCYALPGIPRILGEMYRGTASAAFT